MTASGEVVFPLLCKDFLDRTKGPSASQSTDEQRQSTEKPASLDHNSDLESKVVQKPLTETAPEAVQVEPNSVDTVASIQPPFSNRNFELTRNLTGGVCVACQRLERLQAIPGHI